MKEPEYYDLRRALYQFALVFYLLGKNDGSKKDFEEVFNAFILNVLTPIKNEF